MNAARRGPVAAFRRGLRAGTIASRNGSASVAPMPFSKVRRGSDFLVMNMAAPQSVCVFAATMRFWKASLLTMPSTSVENR